MNKNLFKTSSGKTIPSPDTINNAGGQAYARDNESQLAQLANTGCFGNTYYVAADKQLKDVIDLANRCSVTFVAQTAIYARKQGLLKDMPAVLCAVLAKRDINTLKKVFPIVINDIKMLRNFVQVIRSGVVGRKSFGTAIKNLIRQYFNNKTPEQLFRQSIGNSPSVGDIIKMVHPKPKDEATSMTYAYLMGKDVIAKGVLPQVLQDYLAFRDNQNLAMPDLNFQFLSSLPLTTDQWTSLCLNSTWTTLRMNLNTFNKHGVFKDNNVVLKVIKRLTDPAEIKKAKVLPYQIYTAYLNIDSSLPPGISQALSKAADIALNNVPDLPANLVIGVDTSGSMSSIITGNRGSASSKVTYRDVAALMASAIAAKSPTSFVVPFDVRYHPGFRMKGSIVDTAEELAKFGGGGTDCTIPLKEALNLKQVDAIVIISDNESWKTGAKDSMQSWRAIQKKNPNAKLINIDISPSHSVQTKDEQNVINIGGFSDAVFNVMANYLNGSITQWVDLIKKINISNSPVISTPVETSIETTEE